jgi:hypothetical protein
VGGDVSVDSEALVVTSSISRPDLPAQSFGGAHRGRVCVHRGECIRVYMSTCVCTVFLKKKNIAYTLPVATFMVPFY